MHTNPQYEHSAYLSVRPAIREELDARKRVLGTADYSDTIYRLLHPDLPAPPLVPLGPEAAAPAARLTCGKRSKGGEFRCRRSDVGHPGLCRTWGRGGSRQFRGVAP